MTIKKTNYDHLYYSTIANLPLEPTWIRENFTRMWEALDTIIERDYKPKGATLIANLGRRHNQIKKRKEKGK
jgi:hypothetical protein